MFGRRYKVAHTSGANEGAGEGGSSSSSGGGGGSGSRLDFPGLDADDVDVEWGPDPQPVPLAGNGNPGGTSSTMQHQQHHQQRRRQHASLSNSPRRSRSLYATGLFAAASSGLLDVDGADGADGAYGADDDDAAAATGIWLNIVGKVVTDKTQIVDAIINAAASGGVPKHHRAAVWFRLSGATKIYRKARAFHAGTGASNSFPTAGDDYGQTRNPAFYGASGGSSESDLSALSIFRYYVVKALTIPTAETCKDGSIDRDLHRTPVAVSGLVASLADLACLHRILAAISAFCDTFYDARGVYNIQVARLALWVMRHVSGDEAVCFWVSLALLMRDVFHLASTFRYIVSTFGSIGFSQTSSASSGSGYTSLRGRGPAQTPRSHSRSRTKYQSKIRALDNAVQLRLPFLSAMVASTGFDLSDFYSTCIGGLFMQLGAPDSTVAPLWDLFLAMGWDAMLSAVVGILASVEEQLNNVQEELGVDASAAQIHACIDSTVDRLRTEANPNILFRFLKPSSAPSAHQFVGSAAGPWANLQRTNSKTFHSAAPTPMARSPEWTGTQDLLPMRRQLSRQSFTSHSSHRSHPRSAQQPSPYVARSERDTNRPHHTSRTATVGTMGWQIDVDDAGASWHDVDSAAERAQLRSKKEKQEKKQKQQRRKSASSHRGRQRISSRNLTIDTAGSHVPESPISVSMQRASPHHDSSARRSSAMLDAFADIERSIELELQQSSPRSHSRRRS